MIQHKSHKHLNPKTALTIGSIFCFFLFGLFDSLKGATLSVMLKDLNFNYSLGGTIVLGQYSGYFLSTILSGIFLDRFGHKLTLILAITSMIAGTAGYASVSILPLLFFFILLVGFGLGTLELCGSNIITTYYPEKKGRYLNILAAISGIGSILSPFLASRLFHAGHSWRFIYYLELIILIPVVLYFICMQAPRFLTLKSSESASKISSEELHFNLFRKDLLLMYSISFMYMSAEMGITTWIAEFYVTEHGYTLAKSAQLLSLFYISMTLGRFFGSFFVDHIGRRQSTVFASICTSVCIIFGIWGPASFAILIALSGAFYSIVFPTVTAMLSSLPSGNSARVQGIYFACGGLGGMFGPWIMGTINSFLGLQAGIFFSAILFLLILILLISVKKHNKNTAA